MNTKLFRKLYIYFKRGKSEIFFVISLYNTYLISKLSGGNIEVLLLSLITTLFITSIIVGYISIKFISPTNQIVNPYSQDVIKAEILLKKGLAFMCAKDYLNAITCFEESLKYNKKWIDK